MPDHDILAGECRCLGVLLAVALFSLITALGTVLLDQLGVVNVASEDEFYCLSVCQVSVCG